MHEVPLQRDCVSHVTLSGGAQFGRFRVVSFHFIAAEAVIVSATGCERCAARGEAGGPLSLLWGFGHTDRNGVCGNAQTICTLTPASACSCRSKGIYSDRRGSYISATTVQEDSDELN